MLRIRTTSRDDLEFELPADGVVKIGSGKDCDLTLDDSSVAPLHCLAKVRGGKVSITACDAAHPISVNGERVGSYTLQRGDTIELGAGMSSNESDFGTEGDGSEKSSQRILVFDARIEDDLPGSEVSGYRIESWLGEGGVGAVYKATQLSLDRAVAIKFLSRRFVNDQRFVDRFLSEAQSMARLSHTNVVAVHDVVHDGELIFFSMEYLPGGTVGDRLREEKTLSLSDALGIALDASQALAWAEELGIVHRDIKPDNLLIASDGAVKVADLGLATQIDADPATDSKRWAGSPRFMAPEQTQGKAVDSRADVYSLGCTLFLCLTGVYPIDGATTQEIIKKKVSSDPPPIESLRADLPASVAETINAMIARELPDRLSSCRAALTAFKAARAKLNDESSRSATPHSPTPVIRQGTSEGRQRWLAQNAQRSLKTKVGAAWIGAALSLGIAGSTFYSGDASSAVNPQSMPSPVPVVENKPKSDPEILSSLDQEREGDPGSVQGKEGTQLSGETRSENSSTPTQDNPIVLRALEEQFPKLLEAEDYRGAKSLLDELQNKHPTQEMALSRALNKLSADAVNYWSERVAEAETLSGQGNVGEAKSILDSAAEKLPKKNFAKQHGEKLAELEAQSVSIEQCAQRLSGLKQEFTTALSSRDFDRAAKVVDRLASEPSCKSVQPFAAKAVSQAQERLAAVREAWQKIGLGIEKAVKDKRRLPLAAGERPIHSQRSYTIKGFDARKATIEVTRPAGESLNVFALSTKTLQSFLVAKSKTLEPPAQQALGLLLLYHERPFRARALLLDKHSNDENKRYLEAIAAAENALITTTTKRLAKWRKSLDNPKSPKTLAAQLQRKAESLFIRFSKTPRRKKIGAGIKALYVAARTKILSQRDLPDDLLQRLFRGTVKSYDNGVIRLNYKFSSRDQLRDFVPKLRKRCHLQVVGNEGANLLGEFRFECGGGDIFQGELRVSGRVPANSYNESSPNINIAMWTHEEDRVTPTGKTRATRSNARSLADYFVFGIGFNSEKVSNRTNVLLPTGRGRAGMPADVLLSASRPYSVHTAPKDECLWAQPHRELKGAKIDFEARMNSKTASFSINGRKARLGKGKRMNRVAPPEPFTGSFSFFTNGEVVLLASVTITGKLNPQWLAKHVREDAVKDFEEFVAKR